MMKRSRLVGLAAALTSAALTVTLAGPAAAHPRPGGGHRHLPAQIDLPAGFMPEGIAVDRGPLAYLGSRADGDIYSVNLRTGDKLLVSPGLGATSPSVGLKVDRGRIYVAGGTGGDARVINARTGKILTTYDFGSDPTFINDVVLSRKRAWFTDSQQPKVYRVSRSRRSTTFTTLTLTGEWKQTAGFNANGIVLSPDRRSLLVVQSSTGLLFRVNKLTGHARQVDLGGALLTNGDGLLRRGRTLYAVRNQLNKIAVVHLSRRGDRGRLVTTLGEDDVARGTTFDVPTTVAFYRGSLFLPNARFNTPSPETADYWISRVPL
jgi:sugar lactone lactonase YvrE